MNLGYLVRVQADRDLDEIADGLVDRTASLDSGIRFFSLAYEAFALLASQPEMGWPCRLRNERLKQARVFRVGKPFEKYLIFYQPSKDKIEILRVLHGARDLETHLSMGDA